MNHLLQPTVEALRGLPPEVIVFIISALPIFEIRGGVIVGLAVFHLPTWRVLAFAFLGNVASVTPLLLFLGPVACWLRRNRLMDRIFHWLFARAERHSKHVNHWGPLGLSLLTASPIPVAGGAWTAVLVALLLGIRRRSAIIALYLGILLGGIIVALLTHGASAGARTLLQPQ